MRTIAPVDKVLTRHIVLMDSVHCPDAVLSSGMAADGSVANAKTTITLYKHAVGPGQTPKTSSQTTISMARPGQSWDSLLSDNQCISSPAVLETHEPTCGPAAARTLALLALTWQPAPGGWDNTSNSQPPPPSPEPLSLPPSYCSYRLLVRVRIQPTKPFPESH
jgi:hypothetical protein